MFINQIFPRLIDFIYLTRFVNHFVILCPLRLHSLLDSQGQMLDIVIQKPEKLTESEEQVITLYYFFLEKLFRNYFVLFFQNK